MPKIVYDIEFKIDSSKIQTVGSTIEKSVGSSEAVESTSSAYKDLFKNLKLVQSESNKASSTFRKHLQVLGSLNKETARSAVAAQKQISFIREQKNEIINLANSTELNAKETASLNNVYAQLENREKQLIVTLKKYRKELSFVEEQQESLNNTTRKSNASIASASKITSGANQVFFSFSDGIQDAAQFQFGFAQGMRAIGNNVSFTAELLAQLNRNAKATGITLGQALKKSLGGVGGALLALNFVISVSTILLGQFKNRSKDVAEEANKAADAVDRISSAAGLVAKEFGLAGEQVLPLVSDQIRRNIAELNEYDKSLKLAKSSLQELYIDLGDGSKIILPENELRARELRKTIKEVEGAITDKKEALGISNLVDVEQLKLLDQKILAYLKEIELQKELRQLIIDNTDFSKKARIEAAGADALGITPSVVDPTDIGLELRAKTIRELQEDLSKEEDNLLKTRTKAEAEAVQKRIDLKKQEINTRLGLDDDATDHQKSNFAAIAQVSTTIAQGLFSNDKAAAIATATVQGALAVQRALASAPPPINYALAAGVVAATAKQIKTIRSTEIGGGSSGGGGGGGGGTASSGRAGQSSGGGGFSIERSDAQSPTFTPSSNTLNAQPTVIVEQKVKNKELAILVKSGNQQIKSRRVGI